LAPPLVVLGQNNEGSEEAAVMHYFDRCLLQPVEDLDSTTDVGVGETREVARDPMAVEDRQAEGVCGKRRGANGEQHCDDIVEFVVGPEGKLGDEREIRE
jgi:hypothetical protein